MTVDRNPQLLCVLIKKHFKTIRAAIQKLLVWKDKVISISGASSGLSTAFLTTLAVVASELHLSQLHADPPLEELYQKLGGAGLQADTDEFVRPSFRWVVLASKLRERIYRSEQIGLRAQWARRMEKTDAQVELLSHACDKHECDIDVLTQELRQYREVEEARRVFAGRKQSTPLPQRVGIDVGRSAHSRQAHPLVKFHSDSSVIGSLGREGYRTSSPLQTAGINQTTLQPTGNNTLPGTFPTPSNLPRKSIRGVHTPEDAIPTPLLQEDSPDITGFAFVAPPWLSQDDEGQTTDTDMSQDEEVDIENE